MRKLVAELSVLYFVLSIYCSEAHALERQLATSRDIRELSRNCERCLRADDAVLLIRSFEVRFRVPDRLEKEWRNVKDSWAERDAAGLVRLGRAWVPPEVLKEADEDEARLRLRAFSLIELGDFKGAVELLEEAAEVHPNRFVADYCLGLHSLKRGDMESAQRRFRKVLALAPQHIGALNNIAIAYIRDRNARRAISAWEQVAAIAGENRFVLENVGRLIKEEARGNAKVSRAEMRKLRDLYSEVAVESGDSANKHVAWLLVPPMAPADQQPGERKLASDVVDVAMCGGTGFVVAPEYILTNRHVVDGDYGVAAAVRVRIEAEESESTELAATLTTVSDELDLALLHCPGLKLDPLSMAAEPPRLGSDVMALGFPEVDKLGVGLKATRGSISGLPTKQCNYLLYDVLINPGNSGGPLLDEHGHVVGINTMFVRTTREISGGISCIDAVAFLKKAIPQLKGVNGNDAPLEWPDIAEGAGESVVLIEAMFLDAAPMLVQADKKNNTRLAFYQDRSCLKCNGSGKASCRNRGCLGGKIAQRYTVPRTYGSGRMRKTIQLPHVRYLDCPACVGSAVRCPACSGSGVAR